MKMFFRCWSHVLGVPGTGNLSPCLHPTTAGLQQILWKKQIWTMDGCISCPFGRDPNLMTMVEGWNVDGPVNWERSRKVNLLYHDIKLRHCNSSTRGSISPPTWREKASSLKSPATKRDSSIKIDLLELPPVTFHSLRDHWGVWEMEIPTRWNSNPVITQPSRQERVELVRCISTCFNKADPEMLANKNKSHLVAKRIVQRAWLRCTQPVRELVPKHTSYMCILASFPFLPGPGVNPAKS